MHGGVCVHSKALRALTTYPQDVSCVWYGRSGRCTCDSRCGGRCCSPPCTAGGSRPTQGHAGPRGISPTGGAAVIGSNTLQCSNCFTASERAAPRPCAARRWPPAQRRPLQSPPRRRRGSWQSPRRPAHMWRGRRRCHQIELPEWVSLTDLRAHRQKERWCRARAWLRLQAPLPSTSSCPHLGGALHVAQGVISLLERDGGGGVRVRGGSGATRCTASPHCWGCKRNDGSAGGGGGEGEGLPHLLPGVASLLASVLQT